MTADTGGVENVNALSTIDLEPLKMPTKTNPCKLPQLTFAYWLARILATALGETSADMFSQTSTLGYQDVELILLAFFFASFIVQLSVTKYMPPIYWTLVVSSSLAGTCISDFLDRTLKLGHAAGMVMLLGILLAIFFVWKLSGQSLSVVGPMTRVAEFFYWSCLIVCSTLGTALGDFTADNLDFGIWGGAGLYGGLMIFTALLAIMTSVSRVLLFWVWCVLTLPFGATLGDLLAKDKRNGGLEFDTQMASIIFAVPLLLVLLWICYSERLGNPYQCEVLVPQFVKCLQNLMEKLACSCSSTKAAEELNSPIPMQKE